MVEAKKTIQGAETNGREQARQMKDTTSRLTANLIPMPFIFYTNGLELTSGTRRAGTHLRKIKSGKYPYLTTCST